MRRVATVPFLLALFAAPALAAEEGRPARVGFPLDAGVLHRSLADLSGDGGFRATRFDVEPGIDLFVTPSLAASFRLAFSLESYDFDGLAAPDPWGDVDTLRLSTFARYAIDDEWTLFGGPSLRFAAERGARWTDGTTFGALAGATYAASEALRIGPGAGVFTEIEDRAVVFPFLLVDWEFAEDLTLGTGRGLGATRGPGLTLEWEVADEWTVALGARWEELRFRLDGDGVAPDGVGEDESFPVFLAFSHRPAPRTTLSVFVGTSLGGRLRVLDRNGHELEGRDYDPAVFFGVALSIPF